MKIFTKKFWIQPDKQKHFLGSLAIMVFFALIAITFTSFIIALFIGYFISTTVELGKELRDSLGYGTEDINDVYADRAGTLTGLILFSTIYLIYKGL